VERLDVGEEAKDHEDVVVGREGGEPPDGEVAHPDDEDEGVDRQERDEDDEDRKGVVVAVPQAPRGGGRDGGRRGR